MQDALSSTVEGIELRTLDEQLSSLVPEDSLKAVAKRGLRGELVFPVPCLLEANPFLISYYRLLLGFSQKEFYSSAFGTSSFKTMELKGVLSAKNQSNLLNLCRGLTRSFCALVDGIGSQNLRKEFLDDLTLLTLGPQLRGGANVKKGREGINEVFEIIHRIVQHASTKSSSNKIELINAAGRRVLIEFAPDPDIVIREKMTNSHTRNIIAIEVKAGTDFSNIHNRVGEAEKSHQKAKQKGFVECWTVVNVEKIDLEVARRESPSTNRFYRIFALKGGIGGEFSDFKNRIVALTGIA